jgi:hypothetical protein
MDYLTSFLIWSLAVFGTANIIVISKIFLKFREWVGKIAFFKSLINCMLCMGFWIGCFWGFVLWSPSEFLTLREYTAPKIFFDTVFNGCVGSAVAWIIYLWTAPKIAGK